MIEQLRKELWEAMYLNPVWPHELLDNIKDPSYKEVSMKPIEGGSVVKLTFVDEEELCHAFYTFDLNNYLQHATMLEQGIETTIYSRDKQVANLMNKIYELSKQKQQKTIIA